MPTVNLSLDDTGKLDGISQTDQRAYAKFKKRLVELTREESITFTWREPRSQKFHKRHFAMIAVLFEAQEQFDDQDNFRKWLEVGAGYCKYVPGPKGKMVALPDSISYEKLDQAEFEPIHESVFRFARTIHSTRFLWPHLSDEQGAEMVLTVLGEFD